MARLTDPIRKQHYETVLSLWNFEGYICWKQRANSWVKSELGMTLREFGRLMHEYVSGGGKIDEVVETQPEYQEFYEFHHDLQFQLPNGRKVYVETVLDMKNRDPDDSNITVVSIHAQ